MSKMSVPDVGQIALAAMSSLAVETFFFGTHTVLILFSARLHLRSKHFTKPTMRIFFVTLFSFFLAAAYYSTSTTDKFSRLRKVSADYSSPDFKQVWSRHLGVQRRCYSAEAWFRWINFILNDTVVFWRAYTLCSSKGRRLQMLLPGIPLVGASLSAIIFCGLRTASNEVQVLSSTSNPELVPLYLKLKNGYRIAQIMSLVLSLLSNASSTLLIFLKTRDFRVMSSRFAQYRHQSKASSRALTLLLESGFLYCLLQLTLVILASYEFAYTKNGDSSSVSEVGPVFDAFLNGLSMLSPIIPVLIVVIVAMKRSVLEAQTMSNHVRTVSAGPTTISITRTTDHEMGSTDKYCGKQ